MPVVIGEAVGPPNEKRALLVEALQQALENTPGPSSGSSVQHFRLVSVEMEHGGFLVNTTTRVTLEYDDGPLPRPDL